MNYYLDQEFIEGFRKSWIFGRKRHFIDLISISIIAEDGRGYYAICSEYDFYKASPWVVENVLNPLYNRTVPEMDKMLHSLDDFQRSFGKTRKQIAAEIYDFINPDLGWPVEAYNNSEVVNLATSVGRHFAKHHVTAIKNCYVAQPTFWGYFADYDWVLFCSLWGTMMDLPAGFPMYCRDLKQYKDEMIDRIMEAPGKFAFQRHVSRSGVDKWFDDYIPANEAEHDCREDALWNRRLHNALKKLDETYLRV